MHINSVDIDWGYLLDRIENMLDLGEEFLTRKLAEYQFDPDLFASILVFRWRQEEGARLLRPIVHPDLPSHRDLLGIDAALQGLRRNTQQFLRGAPANHILLRGSRGSGKSSAVKGLLSDFGDAGLRLIEIRKEDFPHLPVIIAQLRPQPYRFILFCDNLRLDDPECDYQGLQDLLDGGLEARPDNVLVYATCNTLIRKPEPNENNGYVDQIHTEAYPLTDGFGILLDVPPASEEAYLTIVRHLVDQRQLSIAPEILTSEALQWVVQRGDRSGRIARQFVDDLNGRLLLDKSSEN